MCHTCIHSVSSPHLSSSCPLAHKAPPFCIEVQILRDNDVIKNILTVTYMI